MATLAVLAAGVAAAGVMPAAAGAAQPHAASGSTLAHVSWLHQHLSGGPGSSITINIDAADKTWIERETQRARPTHALGIRAVVRRSSARSATGRPTPSV